MGGYFLPLRPRAFWVSHDLRAARRKRCAQLSEHIVEQYHYGRDGTVTVTIQNQTRGYQRRFVLGATGELRRAEVVYFLWSSGPPRGVPAFGGAARLRAQLDDAAQRGRRSIPTAEYWRSRTARRISVARRSTQA